MSTIQTMGRSQRRKTLTSFLIFFVLLSLVSLQTHGSKTLSESSCYIDHDMIVQQGIQHIRIQQRTHTTSSDRLVDLAKWYNLHPLVTYASLIDTSITIRFVDGSYTVLMNPNLLQPPCWGNLISRFVYERYSSSRNTTAVILNPAEHMYGHYQCQRIIATLLRKDYSFEYRANQAVDLTYIKNNLSADIIFMNTHAGYFDIDGDQQADAVVIATGELWTNDTEEKYGFDYQNHFIVKGLVGNQAFIAFTPAFIEYYYTDGGFPDSLVFMATCYALFDTSMAETFLNAGASVYMGWSQNTVFWINSRTAVHAFDLLSYGLTVQQVCRLIRSGGFYNWLFHSKLIYHGNGDHRIP